MRRPPTIACPALLLALALILAARPGLAASAPVNGPDSCLKCHAGKPVGDWRGDLGLHAELACDDCHQGVEAYPHKKASLVSCLECHRAHDRSLTGDPHTGVSCAACHLAELKPLRSEDGETVKAMAPAALRGSMTLHRLVRQEQPASCQRCHHPGNLAGASATVLPPKGLLCLPCHVGSPNLPDWPSRIALGVLILGLLAAMGFWLGGGRATGHHRPRSSLGGRLVKGLQALVLDGLLQRRLWRYSPGRGLIHAMIFWPFVLRFLWALAALVLDTWWPQLPLTQVLSEKNHPAHALFFDLTGLLVLAGVAATMLRRQVRPDGLPSGLPRPDWAALGLLGGAVLTGFAVGAIRLAMTGRPAGGQWAVAGWAMSFLFSPGAALQQAYVWLWYAHAVAWCGFVAYLPFGRMFHLITAPLALALRGAEQD